MSVILLVRHGQASFGAADYDQLSPEGEKQSAILGRALADRGIVPARVVRGSMKRHAQTATHAGFADAEVDDAWNEFDHLQVLAVHTPPDAQEAATERRAFQAWFEQATQRWMTGDYDEEYDESFSAFTTRVDAGFRRTAEGLGSGETAVVVTSGGSIASVAAALLGGGADLWHRLNSVCVNTGITKVVVGARGMTLVSFNDHVHLEPDHVTYR